MAKTKLDKDYFYGQIQVADVENTAVERNLKVFILQYEEPFLALLLGQALYDAYVAGMNEVAPAAKWTALNAELYQVSGSTKLSPAAHYVYWYWMRTEATQTTASGEKINNPDKSIPIGNVQKAKLAWNAMVIRNRNLIAWIKARPEDYPEYVEPVYAASTDENRQLYLDRTNIVKTLIPFF